jgi:hypothetical protein
MIAGIVLGISSWLCFGAGNTPGFGLQTLLYCPNAGHHACPHTNLCVNVVQVKFNGFLANVNLTGDCLIGFASNHGLKNFQFAWS